MHRLVPAALVAALAILAPFTAAPTASQQAQPPLRSPDVIFVPTRDAVVEAMLNMANVTKNDVVYDLGSGDGKIVIAAAKRGARAIGVDIDPVRIKEANANAQTAGVTDRVTFINGDIFDPAIKINEASVVTLYLLPALNLKLRPRLWAELKPGTRVVSNSFDMGQDWPARRRSRSRTTRSTSGRSSRARRAGFAQAGLNWYAPVPCRPRARHARVLQRGSCRIWEKGRGPASGRPIRPRGGRSCASPGWTTSRRWAISRASRFSRRDSCRRSRRSC
jgi:hypothetical protein